MRGKFIVFEGGEGSGKSTAINEAVTYLKTNHDAPVIKTREPGGTPNAEIIRSILITEGATYDSISNTLLFATARRDHVEKQIRPSLEAGFWVVCDRYFLSTLAYQGAEGVDPDFIRSLHASTTGDLLPDHTIILDVDPRIGLERSIGRLSQERNSENRFEGYDLAFHDRMRSTMLTYDLSPRTVIDASRSQDLVLADVLDVLKGMLPSSQSVENTTT